MIEKRDKSLELIVNMTKSIEEEGGLGFDSLIDFIDGLKVPGGDRQARLNLAQLCRVHGTDIIAGVLEDAPEAIPDTLKSILAKEGPALQALLT